MFSDLTGQSARPRCFRVLIVDDDAAARELTARHLGDAWPFEHDLVVEEAADGSAALAKLLSDRWTLVLLDWKMPGPDGGEVLRAMRRAGITVPVVILSGLALEELAPTLAHYRVEFLHKDDINATRLHDAMAAALDGPAKECD